MEETRPAVPASTRAWQVIGFALGVVFLGLGVAAFFLGGGPIVGAIGVVGGVLCLAASVITVVRR